VTNLGPYRLTLHEVQTNLVAVSCRITTWRHNPEERGETQVS